MLSQGIDRSQRPSSQTSKQRQTTLPNEEHGIPAPGIASCVRGYVGDTSPEKPDSHSPQNHTVENRSIPAELLVTTSSDDGGHNDANPDQDSVEVDRERTQIDRVVGG